VTAQANVVPDASVILKWVFKAPKEDHAEKALLLLDEWVEGRINLIVPTLWCFEVGNILGLKSVKLASETMALLLEYHFEEQAMSVEICSLIFSIMNDCKVTFYDAAYHAVALIRRATLLTADEAYVCKANHLGQVMLLKDWKQTYSG
jgi:predicted nucleic acid-binding protein